MRQAFEDQSGHLRSTLADLSDWHAQIARAVEKLRATFANGKKVLVAGNGGSATLAQHFSDEMVGRYRAPRPPLPVVALTADSAVLTCIGNDFGFEHIFSRQIEAIGQEGDLLIVFSTSGESPNITRAREQAQSQQMTVIAFTGPNGTLAQEADLAVISPAQNSPRIQELNLHAVHLICETFEPDSAAP
jgi:D-sedoheptulose 7-phosphate isomerase